MTKLTDREKRITKMADYMLDAMEMWSGVGKNHSIEYAEAHLVTGFRYIQREFGSTEALRLVDKIADNLIGKAYAKAGK